MLLTLITVFGIAISVVLLIRLIGAILKYKQLYLITAPRDRDQRRDFNENKHDQAKKTLNLLLMFLTVGLITGVLAYVGLLTRSRGASPVIADYQKSEWKIESVKWSEVSLKNKEELLKTEQELATNLALFLGPNTVVLQPGTLDSSLTVSVTSFVPSYQELKRVKQNFSSLIEESNQLTEIKVFDFSYAYYDEKQKYGKESIVYFREKAQNDLIKLE